MGPWLVRPVHLTAHRTGPARQVEPSRRIALAPLHSIRGGSTAASGLPLPLHSAPTPRGGGRGAARARLGAQARMPAVDMSSAELGAPSLASSFSLVSLNPARARPPFPLSSPTAARARETLPLLLRHLDQTGHFPFLWLWACAFGWDLFHAGDPSLLAGVPVRVRLGLGRTYGRRPPPPPGATPTRLALGLW